MFVTVCLCCPGVVGRIHSRPAAGGYEPFPECLGKAVLIFSSVRRVRVKLYEGLLPGIVKASGDPGEILIVQDREAGESMGVMDCAEGDVKGISRNHIGEQSCPGVRTIGAALVYAFVVDPRGEIKMIPGQSLVT